MASQLTDFEKSQLELLLIVAIAALTADPATIPPLPPVNFDTTPLNEVAITD